MKFPTVYVNHGAGPMPLMGKQPEIAKHLAEVRTKWLPFNKEPDAIVIVSGHWEGDPIQISSSPKPGTNFDYGGFPPETRQYQYPAPGSPQVAQQIQDLLQANGIKSELNDQRGFDLGVFVALMCMFPDATIPVVAVSLHASLTTQDNWKLGQALAPLREQNILIVGSGSSYHNMQAGFHPTGDIFEQADAFNEWLKATATNNQSVAKLQSWDSEAPYAKTCHPRPDHFLPLIMAAAGASPNTPAGTLIYDNSNSTDRSSFLGLAVSSYLFE